DSITVTEADSICEDVEAGVFCSSISISVLLLGVTSARWLVWLDLCVVLDPA
ncbi:14606_t:CDS:1, partial [Acaulospora colombiana]